MALPASGLGLLGLVLALALPWAIPQRTLTPTGPHGVGTFIIDVTDPERLDTYTPDPEDHRELPVQLWYPADTEPGSPEVENAPRAQGLGRLPVVLAVHGGTSVRHNNLSAYWELASHGYLVVAADHTHMSMASTFVDGRTVMAHADYLAALELLAGEDILQGMADPAFQEVLEILVADVSFLLDALGRLDEHEDYPLRGLADLEHVGLMGHSLGAATVAEACRRDRRCDAVLILDGVMPGDILGYDPDLVLDPEPFPAPILFLQTQNMVEHPVAGPAYQTSRAAFEGARGPAWYGEVQGAGHLDVSDLPLVLAPPVASALMGGEQSIGSIDTERSVRLTGDLALAFFDRHLRGQEGGLLDHLDTLPEVRFEERR